jgi:Xaa-Pro aminopeptidase
MAISPEERNRRYSAIREKMKPEGLDSLLVVGRDGVLTRGNIRYITGYGVVTGEQYCVFPPQGLPIFISGKGPTVSRLRVSDWPLDFRTTSDPGMQIVKELSDLDRGGKIGIVGMQEISVPIYLKILEKFGKRLVDAAGIFRQLRLIKSPEELEKMRVSAAIADKVFYQLKGMLRPGLSGYKIYGEIKKTILQMGCDYSFELISTRGASVNLYHPTGEKLESNGTIALEISPAYEGYFAQLPINLPVGDYPPPALKVLPTWKRALQAGESVLIPGKKVSDVYQAVNRVIQGDGYVAPWRPGHAIGLDLIDFWSITDSNETVLEPGMTIAFHPNVLIEPYIEGLGFTGGYTYLITSKGNERFSKVDFTK